MPEIVIQIKCTLLINKQLYLQIIPSIEHPIARQRHPLVGVEGVIEHDHVSKLLRELALFPSRPEVVLKFVVGTRCNTHVAPGAVMIIYPTDFEALADETHGLVLACVGFFVFRHEVADLGRTRHHEA